jgi:hypothetical protein
VRVPLAKSLGRPLQIPLGYDVNMKKYFAKRVPNLAKWQSCSSLDRFIISFHFTAFHFISAFWEVNEMMKR